MEEMTDLTPQELLNHVNNAIKAVTVGGQSYKIGSRTLTRANLAELKAMRADLIAEANNVQEGFLGGAYVAEFNGR